MKFPFVVVVLACCTASVLSWSPEVKGVIKKVKAECFESTRVPEDLVDRAWKEIDFSEDVKLKDFFYCFWKKAGMMSDAGDYVTQAMKKVMGPEIGEDVVDKVIAQCTKKTHGSGPENAYRFCKCFHEVVPLEIILDM